MDLRKSKALIQMCRSCLENVGTVSLFDKAHNLSYSQMLLVCTSVTVLPDDGGPLQLCSVCTCRLKDAFTFRNQCQQSEVKLREVNNFKKEIKTEDILHGDVDFIVDECALPPPEICEGECSEDVPSHSSDDTYKYEELLCNLSEHDTATDDIPLKQIQNEILAESLLKQEKLDEETAGREDQFEKPPSKKTIGELYLKDVEIVVKKKLKKKRKRPKEHRYFCHACPYSAPERYQLNYHMRRHTGEKPYKCDVCGARFAIGATLRKHKESHSNCVCDICGKLYVDSQSLRLHRATHRDTKAFQCHMCAAAYCSRAQLTVHIRSHNASKVKNVPCNICNKMFYSRSIKEHMKVHTVREQLACSICHKVYLGKGSLQSHMRRHSSIKKFMCDHCSKSFYVKAELRIHMITHFGKKTFECDECGKKFVRQSSIAVHKKSHSKIRSYACDICSQRFVHPGSLYDHKKKKHNVQYNRHVIPIDGL